MHFHGINVNIYFNKNVTNAIKMMNDHRFIDWLCADSQRNCNPQNRDINATYQTHFNTLKLDAQITDKTYTKRLEKLQDMQEMQIDIQGPQDLAMLLNMDLIEAYKNGVEQYVFLSIMKLIHAKIRNVSLTIENERNLENLFL